MKCEEATAILVENGCSVEYKSWHIYKRGRDYVILNMRASLPDFDEEVFDILSDAVSKFIFRTKI